MDGNCRAILTTYLYDNFVLRLNHPVFDSRRLNKIFFFFGNVTFLVTVITPFPSGGTKNHMRSTRAIRLDGLYENRLLFGIVSPGGRLNARWPGVVLC